MTSGLNRITGPVPEHLSVFGNFFRQWLLVLTGGLRQQTKGAQNAHGGDITDAKV